MIRTIHDLGVYSLAENPSILRGLSVPIHIDKGKEQYLLVIDFSTREEKINVIPYQIHAKTYEDYKYIGAADGANSPQWYGTVKNIGYILSQTVMNLLERWDKDDSTYKCLEKVHNVFFEDLGIKKSSEKRYQYILNPKFFNGKRTENDNKKALKELEKIFTEFLKKELHINPNDVLLYTLAINGELIVNAAEYERLVLEEKFSVFNDDLLGICAITNQEDMITGKTTKLKFNYYINDKINFASDIEEKNYYKNMAIGKKAYKNILVGESIIQRQFNTRFNYLPCFIIPQFLYNFKTYENIPFDDFSVHIMNLVYSVQTLGTLEELEESVENFIEYSGIDNHLSLNFLFYTRIQAALKVNKFFPNVPVNHLKKLQRALLLTKEKGNAFFGDGNWNLGLDSLYYLIPMKQQKGENFEKRKILLLYEALLADKVCSYDWLIQQFLLLAKIHMFEQYDVYQITDSKTYSNDHRLVNDMLRAQLLLKLLYDLKLMNKGGEGLMELQLVDEQLVNYLIEMKFDEQKTALVLLGILIAQVGAAQVTKNQGGSSVSHSTSSKPVLNKINFQGMNKKRIQMLSTDVFEMLRINKRLSTFNELIFAEHKRLFDKNLVGWSLSDRENVFYILSGYAYGTKSMLNSRRNKREDA